MTTFGWIHLLLTIHQFLKYTPYTAHNSMISLGLSKIRVFDQIDAGKTFFALSEQSVGPPEMSNIFPYAVPLFSGIYLNSSLLMVLIISIFPCIRKMKANIPSLLKLNYNVGRKEVCLLAEHSGHNLSYIFVSIFHFLDVFHVLNLARNTFCTD